MGSSRCGGDADSGLPICLKILGLYLGRSDIPGAVLLLHGLSSRALLVPQLGWEGSLFLRGVCWEMGPVCHQLRTSEMEHSKPRHLDLQ